MAYDGRYDHPRYLTAFLNGKRLTLEEFAQDLHVSHRQGDKDNSQDNESSGSPSKITGSATPGFVSAASSPPVGTRAPPPTPETTVLTSAITEHLPSINEDGDSDSPGAIKIPQPNASSTQFRPTARPFRPITPAEFEASLGDSPKETLHYDHSKTISHLKDKVQDYQDDVVRKFVEQTEARIALGNITNSVNKRKAAVKKDQAVQSTTATAAATGLSDDVKLDVDVDTSTAIDSNVYNSSAANNGIFQDIEDELTAFSERSDDDDDSSINIIVDAPTSPGSFKAQKSTVIMSSPDKMPEELKGEDVSLSDLALNETSQPEQGEVEVGQAEVEIKEEKAALKEETVEVKEEKAKVEEESREDATYFSSWGTPASRTTDPARIRKIILENIPPSADLSFVQSLIHGGAIEVMTLGQGAAGTTCAHVTFTDADACDKYFKAYPNGLEYKHKGKKYVTFVHKGKDVDVVSGVMKNYLACGATRVVHAVNADEDWSLRALTRIAEGPNSRRKIEAVVDTYSNNIRNIVFRFTNIPDAVTFRGQLLRDTEWKGTDIVFASDPCEKATGIDMS